MRLRPELLVILVAALVAGCSENVTPERNIKLADCRLPRLSVAAQCGTIEVPEDRANPAGRKVTIFAAVLPANTVSPKADPLVILAGGPGQAASNLAPFASRLTEVRRTRDVVLIDQRGTGRSSPLSCAAFKPREDEVFETDPTPRARECAADLKAQGIDAAQYTTSAWIADLEAMRSALGYTRWNVWGGSYGTRVAQEYLRRHPDRVRTMILDGVAPPGLIISLDVWRTREAALTAIFKACADNDTCRKALPDIGGVLQTIESNLGPEGRDTDVIDPSTGATQSMRVTFDVVIGALQSLTYHPELATMIPEMLALAARGDFGPIFAANPANSGRESDLINVALHFSVTCAEDAPRVKPGSEQAVLAGLPTKKLAEQTLAVCAAWPRGSVPADFNEPVQSNVPALLLSGGMDPVTPPAYGTTVAQTLPNSMHIVAPGYGHIVSAQACAPRLIASFVEEAGTAKLAPTCLQHFAKSVSPPLWSNRLAPQP